MHALLVSTGLPGALPQHRRFSQTRSFSQAQLHCRQSVVTSTRFLSCSFQHDRHRSDWRRASGVLSDEASVAASSAVDDVIDLPLPAQRYQKVPNMKDLKALRTASNTLAKEKTIQRITCGQNGITQSFLNACTDVLGKHTYLRIKLGEGAGLERGSAAKSLERYLDAVAVHQIGFTITLYREPGLPRPSNCPSSGTTPDAADHQQGSSSAGEQLTAAAAAAVKRVPDQRTSAKSAERAAAGKAAAKKQPKGPPEFSVV